VQGNIQVKKLNDTHTSFILNLTDPTNRLHPSGSHLHIHQVGVSSFSTSCAEALKHYNPILNYGEISGRAGLVPVSGNATIVANWLYFEGDYAIQGRSIVVHDNTTTRLACCTIESLLDTGVDPGYAQSVLKARFNGLNVTIYNNSIGEVTVNYSIDALVYTKFPAIVSIGNTGGCTTNTDFRTGLPQLSGTSLSVALNGVTAANFGDWAGKSVLVTNGTNVDCAILVQTAAQPNGPGNDFYVDPTVTSSSTSSTTSSTTSATSSTTSSTTASTTSSTTSSTTASTTQASTTGNGVMIVFSVILLVIAILFN
jgi:hypothetical protein